MRGREFVTMVRPWDVSYDRRGRFHARPEHAPVAWVGDNRRDWVGLADALDHVFRSAEAGYVVVGSDIGGYLDRDDQDLLVTIPFDLETFQRWVAVGAMMPFMQLHGRANLEPWSVPERPDETVAVYRYWATLHHEMVGFWYSLTEEAYAAGEPILHPIGTEADWPGDFRYVVGEHFLVAPILEAGGVRDVELPGGARWYDWFDGAAHEGGTTLSSYDASAAGRIPLFVREGAIVPVDVEGDVTGLGTAGSAGHLTVLAWPSSPATGFRLHEEDEAVTTIGAVREADGALSVTLSRARRPTLVRVHAGFAPSRVAIGAADATEHADRAALDAAASGWLAEAGTPLRVGEARGERERGGARGLPVSGLAQLTDAIEVLAGARDAPVFVTCEHASQRMPLGFRWPDADRRLIDTHWAYDLGAREMARSLAEGLDAGAVLSRYSRLLIDPNRPLGSPTLFRTHAEGAPIELNTTELDEDERRRRIERLYRPYHEAIDRELARSAGAGPPRHPHLHAALRGAAAGGGGRRPLRQRARAGGAARRGAGRDRAARRAERAVLRQGRA
ncbi:MAG: N-formylglutamate amidohydrolase [Sandaracinaceae bacterium]|nr:N-formylglutamate amidohydrolase [Sandaracinaceae bacterium]